MEEREEIANNLKKKTKKRRLIKKRKKIKYSESEMEIEAIEENTNFEQLDQYFD